MFFFFRTNSLPNFLGTFVQPNLTITNNNNNNNNIVNNNNNKPTVTVGQTTAGFQKVMDDDNVDITMLVDDVKLQHQQQCVMNLQQSQRLENSDKPTSETHYSDSMKNRNRIVVKKEEDEISSPSPSPFIDINSLPMVFDDTKLFQNVSSILFEQCVFK